MTLQLTYGEIKELAGSKVDNFSLWYVDNSKIHILVKVRKFLMTHKINVDLSVKEVRRNVIYLSYEGDISWLASIALGWGMLDKYIPSYIKRNGKDLTVILKSIRSFPHNLEVSNIFLYQEGVKIVFNFKIK